MDGRAGREPACSWIERLRDLATTAPSSGRCPLWAAFFPVATKDQSSLPNQKSESMLPHRCVNAPLLYLREARSLIKGANHWICSFPLRSACTSVQTTAVNVEMRSKEIVDYFYFIYYDSFVISFY